MKINKKLIAVIMHTMSLCACANNNNNEEPAISPSITNLNVTGENDIHTDYQKTYLEREDYTDTGFACGTASWSAPNAIKLSWESNIEETTYVVTLSEDEIFDENDVNYTVNTTSLDFYNAKINTTYYWNVKIGEYTSQTASFTTKSTGPRNLYIEGVENARDIGGWGNIIKQGMLIRSGRFNKDKSTTVVNEITDNGISEMVNHLKIKTEIDLRRTSTNEVGSLTNTSVLGQQVKYIQIPMAYGGNNILTFQGKLSGDNTEHDNPAAIKTFFEILADEASYPISFHCSIGKDRTGCLSYLVEALLGADEEYLIRDYMFTNFAKVGGFCEVDDINGTRYYGTTIANYEIGSNTQEKTYNYLNNVVGISTTTLDKVISILKVQ